MAAYNNYTCSRNGLQTFRCVFPVSGEVVSGYRVRNGEWTELGRKSPKLPEVSSSLFGTSLPSVSFLTLSTCTFSWAAKIDFRFLPIWLSLDVNSDTAKMFTDIENMGINTLNFVLEEEEEELYLTPNRQMYNASHVIYKIKAIYTHIVAIEQDLDKIMEMIVAIFQFNMAALRWRTFFGSIFYDL